MAAVSEPNQERTWDYMIGFIALPHVGGFMGWYSSRYCGPKWYEHLRKPHWSPNKRTFPIMWSAFYTSMGYASYLVWNDVKESSEKALLPLGLYGIQMVLAWTWVPLFFRAHKIKLALCNMVLLYGTVVATMIAWYPINRKAVALMVPYVLWLSVTSSLNYCIWRDNPQRKRRA
ncbi:translocator protein-like isoform X2 [Rhinatrema bivittatum]|uniref:translocator protein-like isoform X2 n=1 Tax=Rhinatrema bivittatum TaxID=194408 RepID=UPI001129DE99|nr:translocator protein-like isoform X2 [Rhinatrema bivittatum]